MSREIIRQLCARLNFVILHVLFLLLPALGIFLCLQQEQKGQYLPCVIFVSSVFFFIVVVVCLFCVVCFVFVLLF